MPGFGVVSGHAHTLLGPSAELVEKMGIYACPCRDDEEAGAGLAFKIETLYAPQSNPARRGMESGPRRRCDIHGQAEIVGEGVSRAHGENPQGSAGIRQHLDKVVDGAIAAAGEDSVEARQDGLPGLLFGMGARVGEEELGFDVCAAQQRQRGFQLRLAPRVAAAGFGVIE